jgi:two-component system sensor histidine kinase UhpB
VPLNTDAALVLYRAAQEGITNALRHGQARRIVLALRGDEETVTLSLTDDGRGLPGPEAAGETGAGHYGLRWLAERIENLDGELRLEPASPSGAKLTVRLPLPVAGAENP